MKIKFRLPYALLFLLFRLTLGGVLHAFDFDADGYGDISDYLDDVYGIDDNAGLTAFPVLNVPMGGRAEGMATAFTAVADDVSFIEYNPAGSSLLEFSELGIFHNNWIADTKVEGAVFATRFKNPKNLGLAGAGKWLYLPFTEYNIYGDRASKGYYSEAEAILNASYSFLSGYYFSGISVGMNLKGAFRFVPDYSDANNTDNYQGRLIEGSGRSQSTGMAMADIGVLTRFDFLKSYYSRDRNMSAALVFKNLGPPAMDDPLPTAATIALAYKPLRPLLISMDFSVPFNLMNPDLSERPYGAIGFAANVTNFLSMRAGLLAKMGNFRVTVGSAVTIDRISLDLNYSMDLLTQLQPMNRISLGVRLNLGDQGRKELSRQVDEIYLLSLEAYASGNMEEGRRNLEAALKLDPQHAPARELLEAIDSARAVQEQMDELQRLNF
ncbi:MAG: UPF0164 family protein [Treponema sp.]|jgi:hypothetical protein|nr:UPF0164 family protein [Treponema sp.]